MAIVTADYDTEFSDVVGGANDDDETNTERICIEVSRVLCGNV